MGTDWCKKVVNNKGFRKNAHMNEAKRKPRKAN